MQQIRSNFANTCFSQVASSGNRVAFRALPTHLSSRTTYNLNSAANSPWRAVRYSTQRDQNANDPLLPYSALLIGIFIGCMVMPQFKNNSEYKYRSPYPECSRCVSRSSIEASINKRLKGTIEDNKVPFTEERFTEKFKVSLSSITYEQNPIFTPEGIKISFKDSSDSEKVAKMLRSLDIKFCIGIHFVVIYEESIDKLVSYLKQ